MPPRSQPPSRPSPPGPPRPVPRPAAGPGGAARGGAPRPGAAGTGGAASGARPAGVVGAARPSVARPAPSRSTPAAAPRRPRAPQRDLDADRDGEIGSDYVDELTQDCFNAIIALRHVDERAAQDPERIHRHLRKLVSKLMQDAPAMRIPHGDAQEMAYAIVALADEVALNGPPALSQYWMGNLLQMHYFDENAAGEGFFEHVEAARSAHRYDVLKVFYLCLTLGFVGRYAMHGGEMELADLAAALRDTLARAGMREPDTLSPRGERPKEVLTAAPKPLKLVWIPVGAVAAAALLYVVLSASVAHKASLLTEILDKLVK